jgi:hypothetical protein
MCHQSSRRSFLKEISHADVGFRLGKKLPIVGQNIHLSKKTVG